MSARVVLVAAITTGLMTGAASGSGDRAAATVRVNTALTTAWKFGDEYCPPGKPVNISCVRFVGRGAMAGLGLVTSTYVKTIESNGCPVTQFNDAVISVKGKGTLTLSRPGKACGRTAPARVGPLTYTVGGGTGSYEGASGSLVFRSTVNEANFGCGPCGTGEDRWTGSITVPGLEVDLTPPVLSGAVSRTVRAPEGAKGARVTYTVTAKDAVDGSRPVSCTPRSGGIFKVGRTKVTCASTDLDGNTATASFTIIVR